MRFVMGFRDVNRAASFRSAPRDEDRVCGWSCGILFPARTNRTTSDDPAGALPDATNEEGGSGWLDDIDGGRVTMAFADALTRLAEKLAAGTHSVVSDLGIKDAAEQAVA